MRRIGYQEGVREVNRAGARLAYREMRKALGLPPLRRQDRLDESRVRRLAGCLFGYSRAENDLNTQGLAMSVEELKGVAVRMQQELPRAWVFVYGQMIRRAVRT